MTNEQLKEKVNEMIANDSEMIQKLIDKAINRGCMDAEGAENNYVLPKNLLSAIYRHMMWEYSPLNGDKKQKKNIDNIYSSL